MGAWGEKIFENDSAIDWITELEEEKDLTLVIGKLAEILQEYNRNKDDLIESVLASEGLAATEIVLALMNKSSDELPKETLKWLKRKKGPDRKLISFFNRIIKDLDLGEGFSEEWVTYSNDEKWEFIISSLKTYSIEVINIVRSSSELNELWKESNEYKRWLETLENLSLRLES